MICGLGGLIPDRARRGCGVWVLLRFYAETTEYSREGVFDSCETQRGGLDKI
ncbi:hypothetical protein MOUN0_N03334 [Monosporozyma unispora]